MPFILLTLASSLRCGLGNLCTPRFFLLCYFVFRCNFCAPQSTLHGPCNNASTCSFFPKTEPAPVENLLNGCVPPPFFHHLDFWETSPHTLIGLGQWPANPPCNPPAPQLLSPRKSTPTHTQRISLPPSFLPLPPNRVLAAPWPIHHCFAPLIEVRTHGQEPSASLRNCTHGYNGQTAEFPMGSRGWGDSTTISYHSPAVKLHD